MNKGFTKVFRKIYEDNYFKKNKDAFYVFNYFIAKCNYEPKEWNGKMIKRGQFVSSFRHIADECFLDISRVRRILNKLKKDKRINWKSYKTYTVFTVLKYADYQGEDAQKTDTQTDTQSDTQADTRKASDNGQQSEKPTQKPTQKPTSTKEDKEYKEEKNNIYTNKQITNEFEELWKLYPNKKGKAPALKKYIKARQCGVGFDVIKTGIENYAEAVKDKEERFIKHGSTWFNNECWNDEYNIKKKTKQELKDEQELF